MPSAHETEAARAVRVARIRPVLACPECRGALTYSSTRARCEACSRLYPIRRERIYFVDAPSRVDDLDRVKGWLKRILGHAYYSVGIQLLAPTDAVVSRSVLEHIPDPADVVREFHRCTKIGGIGIHMMPFLFPVHASPVDYHRFTPAGHDILFKCWDCVSRTNPTGPVTVLLLHVIEVLSTILGLGIARLRSLAYLFLCGVTFPLKFLDVIFVNRPAFMSSAASVLSVVRKTSE